MSPTPEARRTENDARYGAVRDGVAVLSPDWKIRYANVSMLEILRLIGRGGEVSTLWDALPHWRESAAADSLREAMECGHALCFRVETQGGGGHVWQVETEPLPAGELRVRLRNVTAQARAERAERLEREAGTDAAGRESRLDAIMRGAPVGIVLLDAATLVVCEANDFYHTFLEGEWSRPGSVVGHAPADFIPGFAGSELQTLFERVRSTGQAVELPEYEFNGFARGPTFFRFTLQPVDADDAGRPRFLLLLVVEVTGQVLARRAAEAERRALYSVLDTLPVGVVVASAPDGRTVYLNAAAAALGGRPAQELTAGEAAEYAERWQAFRATGEPYPPGELPLTRALRGEPTRDEEVVLRLPGGEERTMITSGVPLLDARGQVDRGMAVFYDLTERLVLERALLERSREAEAAAAEAALRAEESRALREMGRALVSELEPARVLDLAARAAMELLGTRGAFVGTPRGDELVLSPALGTLAEAERASLPIEGTEVGRTLRDQQARWLNSPAEVGQSPLLELARERGVRNAAFAPLSAFGEPVGVLGVVDREAPFTHEDLRLLQGLADQAALAVHNAGRYAAERRRGEESRALLDAAEALTRTLDPGEVMERIALIASELAHADGAVLSMVSGDHGERTTMAMAVGILAPLRGHGGATAGTLTERVIREARPQLLCISDLADDHPARPMLAAVGAEYYAALPLRGGGETPGVLAVVHTAESGPFSDADLRLLELLADQAALAVRNARLYERAQAASRAKSEFLAMMSHELRTPLNALEGYASLIEDEIYGPVNEQQRKALERMRVSRRHLMALIDKVLDLARVEAGTRRAELEDASLRDLVETAVEAMRGAAHAKGLSLSVEAAEAGRFRTDPGLLRQVLTNLLGNALKFTEQGGVAVRARCDGDGALVEVEDTGPGIAPENQERIFEAFYQVDPSITRKEGGSGLGLALSRDFTRLLGGELTVRSEPGRGSTFTVHLPTPPPAV